MSSDTVQRKLTTILAADAVAYSAHIGRDEEGTLARLKERAAVIEAAVSQHGGRIFDTAGDARLAEFSSPVEAVRCAIALQRKIAELNTPFRDELRLLFRVGINLGDVVIDGTDLLGDGVNVAARLESLAEPGGIMISGTVYEQVRGKLDCHFADLGRQRVKNIAEPVPAYAVRTGATKTAKTNVLNLALAAAIVVLAAAIGVFAFQAIFTVGEQESGNRAPRKSIAVLPFVDMSPDGDQQYFSDGMAEELLNALAKLKGLRVAARTSTFLLRGSPISEVGETLNVATVLEGSVRKSGTRLRITAQLINVADGYHLWTETYDRELTDVFAIQDEIARAIVRALQVHLGGKADEPLVRQATSNMEAYGLYLTGLSLVGAGSPKDHLRATGLLRQAVQRDPDFAAAHANLGIAYVLQAFLPSVSPLEMLTPAREAVEKALALDPQNPEALTALGVLRYWLEWDWLGAEAPLRRAVALKPNGALGLTWLGDYLYLSGRMAEALDVLQRAEELDPSSSLIKHISGVAYVWLRDYKRAEAKYEMALALKPDDFFSLWRLYYAKLYQRDHAGADKILDRLGRLQGIGRPLITLLRAGNLALAGEAGEARVLLGQIQEAAQRGEVSLPVLGNVYLMIDEQETAVDWWERAYEVHDQVIIHTPTPLYATRNDEALERLFQNPRWQALWARPGLKELADLRRRAGMTRW